MKLFRYYFAILFLFVTMASAGLPPIKYVTAVRNPEGKALANHEMTFVVEILDSPTTDTPLYSETHVASSNSDGTVTLMIGTGNVSTGKSFDQLDWSGRRFVKVSADTHITGYRAISLSELGAAPITMESAESRSLVTTSPNGTPWELKVSNNGSLYWECLGQSPDTPPVYDESRIPDKLYFIGTFNSWKVANAVPMEKISKYKFSITRKLEPDEIFKFVPTQSWDNDFDWSGQQMKIGTPVPLVEFGNTPKFTGTQGTYTITVDFHSFTMTITPQ